MNEIVFEMEAERPSDRTLVGDAACELRLG